MTDQSDLIVDHEFAPYTYDGRTFCIEPVRGHTCDRPAAEHERVPEINPQGDTSTVDKATSS